MNRLLDTNTRYFDQDSFEIPLLTNTWGAMVDFLDCALVQGTLTQDVLYIAINEEELYWIFKLSLNSNHGFKSKVSVVNIQESSEPLLNGIHRVQEVYENTITIAILKDGNQPVDILDTTGITIALAPLGYEKVFEGFQKGVYKSKNVLSKKAYLRVDNSCPEGYDPSWAKFSRVAMFSDMENVDDYEFRLGRLKAPCWANDYERAENRRDSVWLNCRSNQYAHVFKINTVANLSDIKEFYIIGDDKTFYIYLKEILHTNSAYYGDIIYTFGNYEKYMNKEDPTPFLLSSTPKHDEEYYMMYNSTSHFSKDTSLGKYVFNTDFNYNFTSQNHQTWGFWLNDSFLSGSDTRVNFKPFKNEVAYNLFPKNIKTHRESNTVMEGCIRGMFDFMCNLNDTPEIAPKHLEVITSDTLYLTTYCRDYYSQYIKHAIKLSDWS